MLPWCPQSHGHCHSWDARLHGPGWAPARAKGAGEGSPPALKASSPASITSTYIHWPGFVAWPQPTRDAGKLYSGQNEKFITVEGGVLRCRGMQLPLLWQLHAALPLLSPFLAFMLSFFPLQPSASLVPSCSLLCPSLEQAPCPVLPQAQSHLTFTAPLREV